MFLFATTLRSTPDVCSVALLCRTTRFKTLWISYEEFHPVEDMYLRPDLIAGDLQQGAEAILRWEREQAS